MLQLPSKAPRFTRAQIAEITRGTTIARARKGKPDPVIRLVASFKKELGRYRSAKAALQAASDGLAKVHADGKPRLWVHPPDDGWPLMIVGGYIYSAEQIDAEEKRRRKQLRAAVAADRRRLREFPDSRWRYEAQQRLAGDLASLAELPVCVKRLKRKFIKQRARIVGIHRRSGYQRLVTAEAEARGRLLRIHVTVEEAKVSTTGGALALIDFCRMLLEAKTLGLGCPPCMLQRAFVILSGERHQ
jgi:hypothetical protein